MRRLGYVYLVRCEDTDYYKIGISRSDPWTRMIILQTGCPITLQMIEVCRSKNYLALESDLHRRLAIYHVRGEWFGLTEEVADHVRGIMRGNCDDICAGYTIDTDGLVLSN